MPALLLGCPLPCGVRFPCSGRYSSSSEDPRIERKDSFSESFCDPDLVVLVRPIGVCRKRTRRLDRLGVTGIDVFCFVEVEGRSPGGAVGTAPEYFFFAFAALSLSSRSFMPDNI